MNRRKFVELGLVAGGAIALRAAPTFASRQSGSDSGRGTVAKVVDSIGRDRLESAVRAACAWLTDIAQIKTEKLGPTEHLTVAYPYTNWKGAIRGEYAPGEKWGFFGPVWHTGQAVKALAMAYAYFREPSMLEGAKLGAEFLRNQQIADPAQPDCGAIRGYEDQPRILNTSCLFEACDGLFTLTETTGDPQYAEQAAAAIDWAAKRMYKGDGIFYDGYDFQKRKVNVTWPDRWSDGGRPLLDDGVLLKAWRHTKKDRFRSVFFEVADRLLKREDPPGNWVGYRPCNWREGRLHPRQAFWWGRPMWMAWKESGQAKYRTCFERACRWYTKAMRHDGGVMRGTYTDFSSESFGHATSATCCACMMFRDACVELCSDEFQPWLELGLRYAMSMQVTKPVDPNMKGVIIEKCLPPDHTDGNPWRVRDLGTIFFVISATQVLNIFSR